MRMGTLAAAAAAVAFVFSTAWGGSPRATRVHIKKSAHTMELLDGERVLERYTVAVGPGGAGPKHREGDRVTPVGRYHVVQRGPSSAFHVFMLIDYPNAADRARFRRMRAAGDLPPGATIGGDVGIHGGNPDGWTSADDVRDWTLGCIAVTDAEIERVAALVVNGTIVDIED
jgi:murein L,D-transpeptidase YafK